MYNVYNTYATSTTSKASCQTFFIDRIHLNRSYEIKKITKIKANMVENTMNKAYINVQSDEDG